MRTYLSTPDMSGLSTPDQVVEGNGNGRGVRQGTLVECKL